MRPASGAVSCANARALSSLDHELLTVQNDVRQLVNDMERSIKEADRFIDEMREK